MTNFSFLDKLFICIFLFLGLIVCTAQINPGVDFDLNTYINNRLDAGETTITVPPGRYRVAPTGNTHLMFQNRNNVTIIADGVEMICTETVQAVRIWDCNNFKLKGLSIDFDPLPFTQGKIVAMNSNRTQLTIDIIDGYSTTITNSNIEIFDSTTGELSTSTYYGVNFQVDALNRRVIATKGVRDLPGMNEKVGDIVVMYSQGTKSIPHGLKIERCNNLVLEDVTLYAGTSFGFYEIDCIGSIYKNCKVDRRPLETEIKSRGLRRMRSNNADGFHSMFAQAGPTYDGCIARYNGDDGIAINGHFHIVTETNGAILTVIGREGKEPNIQIGDEIEILTYSGVKLPNAKVINKELGRAVNFTEKTFLQNQTLYGSVATGTRAATNVYYITLDTPVNLPMGSLINSANRIGNGFEIKNCTVGPNRSRGILLQAGDGAVTNNTCVYNWSSAIMFAPEYGWLAAGSGNNVVFSDNTITGCHASAIAAYSEGGDGTTSPVGAHDNIKIFRNSISNSVNPAIAVTSTSNLCVSDNTISSPNNSIILPQFKNIFGHNQDPTRAIYLENVTETTCSPQVLDEAISIVGPSTVTQGQLVSVDVEYTTTIKRDIVVYFQNAVFEGNGEGRITVEAGSGTATVNVQINLNAIPGGNYRYMAFVTEVGGAWEQRVGGNGSEMTGVTVSQTLNLNNIIETDFKIYPNPAEESIQISTPESSISNLEVKIFNIVGHLVLKNKISSEIGCWKIDIANLPGGIYVLEARLGNKIGYSKIIKK